MRRLIAMIVAAVLAASALFLLNGCGNAGGAAGTGSSSSDSVVSAASAAVLPERSKRPRPYITSERYAPNTANYDVRLRVEATDKDGHTVWRKFFGPSECFSERFDDYDTIQFIDIHGDLIFINVQALDTGAVTGEFAVTEDGLYALDVYTGEIVWRNADFCGTENVHVIDPATHILYMSCYYGPYCIAVDMDGNTLWAVENAPISRRYPQRIELDEDCGCIKITYGDIDSGEDIEYLYIGYDGTVME